MNNALTGNDGANVILTNVNPTVSNPIAIHDYQWWMSLSVRDITTTFPTDLYYEPSWPDGILHFWPVPNTDYGLQLITRLVLADVSINDAINLPPGYHNALMLTLAEDTASSFGQSVAPKIEQKAIEARARIFRNNDFHPRISTQDAGMPSNHRNRATFNYKTGLDMNVNN